MKIDKALRLAYQYYKAGDLNQARNLYKKILSVNPNNINALHFLEMICCQLEDFDDAIRYRVTPYQVRGRLRQARNDIVCTEIIS